jgi:glycogen synthase kinase 3 beta
MSTRPHLSHEARTLQPNPRFECKSTIGIGTFGAVFLATDRETGKDVAIKKVCQDPRFKNRELEIVRLLKHPNCLHYVYHYIEGRQPAVFLHLVTDYVPDSLSSFIAKYQSQPSFLCPSGFASQFTLWVSSYLKIFGFQLFAALYYLHVQGVCHRDVKPSNVLVDAASGYLQLCDFGSAKFLRPDEASVSYIATRSYRAPELLLEGRIYTTAIDIWAAGCVLCEMVTRGRPIFLASNNEEMCSAIAKVLGPPGPTDFVGFAHKKQFPKTGERWSGIAAALGSEAPPDFVEFMKTVLVYDPRRRATAADCMTHPFFADVVAGQIRLPNGMELPQYIKKMRTPAEARWNFPDGPRPP